MQGNVGDEETRANETRKAKTLECLLNCFNEANHPS